jgi:hypothetical protein
MDRWNDVPGDESPFADVEPVDGLVYAPDQGSPELRMPPAGYPVNPVPPPVFRAPPQRPQRRTLGPWKPGGDPDPLPTVPLPTRRNPLPGLIFALIPIALLAGLILLGVNLYGG